MCNLSLQIVNSTSELDETLKWYMYYICQGKFGTFAFIISTALFLFLGTPIHCWSLQLLLRGNIKPNFVLPLNLAVVDLLFCIQSFADLITAYYISVASYNLSMFLFGLCWTVRPLLQIFISMEHYLAVIHPVIFLRYKGIQYRVALAAAAWLVGMANGMRLNFIAINFFPDHVFFLFFWTAVIIISFCCVSVLHALKRSGPGDRKNVEMREKNRCIKTDRGRAVDNQQKRKAFRIILHILMSVLICYLPLVVAYILLIAEISKEIYMCTIFPLSLCITAVSVIIVPLVRMYSEGHLKHILCLSKLREQIKDK